MTQIVCIIHIFYSYILCIYQLLTKFVFVKTSLLPPILPYMGVRGFVSFSKSIYGIISGGGHCFYTHWKDCEKGIRSKIYRCFKQNNHHFLYYPLLKMVTTGSVGRCLIDVIVQIILKDTVRIAFCYASYIYNNVYYWIVTHVFRRKLRVYVDISYRSVVFAFDGFFRWNL